jgi:hypothetical protein
MTMETMEGNMKRGILINLNHIAWTVSFFALRLVILFT